MGKYSFDLVNYFYLLGRNLFATPACLQEWFARTILREGQGGVWGALSSVGFCSWDWQCILYMLAHAGSWMFSGSSSVDLFSDWHVT